MSAVPFPLPVVGLAWHAGAACRRSSLPADTWDDHVADESALERSVRHGLATDVCARCPVAEACLADHLTGYGGGVRAGYVFEDASDYRTQAEHVIRDPMPREPAACGSARGARAHKYRGEDVCGPCDVAHRAEHAARNREYRRQARERRARELEEALTR